MAKDIYTFSALLRGQDIRPHMGGDFPNLFAVANQPNLNQTLFNILIDDDMAPVFKQSTIPNEDLDIYKHLMQLRGTKNKPIARIADILDESFMHVHYETHIPLEKTAGQIMCPVPPTYNNASGMLTTHVVALETLPGQKHIGFAIREYAIAPFRKDHAKGLLQFMLNVLHDRAQEILPKTSYISALASEFDFDVFANSGFTFTGFMKTHKGKMAQMVRMLQKPKSTFVFAPLLMWAAFFKPATKEVA